MRNRLRRLRDAWRTRRALPATVVALDANLAAAQEQIAALTARAAGLERYVLQQAPIIADHKFWLEALLGTNNTNAARRREVVKRYTAARARAEAAITAAKKPETVGSEDTDVSCPPSKEAG